MDEDTIHRRRWVILGVLVICLLVVILDNTILNVALKTIQQDLGASQSQMQWAVDSYMLVFAGLLIPGGVLGDRIGRKTVLAIGMATFGATSLLCSYAHTPAELIGYRALMGIGAALVQPQTLSILQNVFPPHERGKAIGFWAASSAGAIALGPITGGLLLEYFWWGSIFLVNVPVVILGLAGIWLLVPNSKDPNPGRVDPLRIALLVAALVALVYGVIEGGNTNDWVSWSSLGAIGLGVVMLTAYVAIEARSASPTIDVRLFRDRRFSAGSASVGIAFFALMGSTFFLAYFQQAVRGYSPLAVGVTLIPVAVGVMFFASRSSKLAERFGARTVAACGLVVFGLALMSFALVGESTPQWVLEVQMFAFGSGMGLTMTPATTAIMSAVPREKAGAGSAVNNTVRQVAGALGVAIIGSVLAVAFRSDLGSARPAQLAAQLDQPAAVVSQLPADAQARTYVTGDTSESIGNAFEFAGAAGSALQRRSNLPPANQLPPEQQAQARAQAQSAINGFIHDAKSSFVSAMGVAALVAGAAALVGAVVASRYLPGRAETRAMSRRPGAQAGGPPPAPAGPPAAEPGTASRTDTAALAEPVQSGAPAPPAPPR